MDFFHHLALGFGVASTLQNLLCALVGCVLGTVIGVLPGIGPLATMTMLLPLTSGLPTVTALILLSGIYYGAQYGGSTTAILVNRAGESSSAVTVVDGYQMARNGRGGAALAAAGVGSFFAGCVATLLLALGAAPLAELALQLGPPEYFSLIVLALIGAVLLSSGSLLKAIAMTVLGMLLGTVGADVNSGLMRFSFGMRELEGGIDFMLIAMGIFVHGHIIDSLGKREPARQLLTVRATGVWLGKQDLRHMVPAVLRGTAWGSLLGVLPGGGAVMAAFAAYALERKTKLLPGEVPFGQGNLRGVAAPESANNAGAQTSFMAMLSFGIAPNAFMALLLGCMTLHGLHAAPALQTFYPEIFWGLIASMWIGNLLLAVLNLPLIGLWTTLLRVPYRWLYPAMVLVCALGVFCTNQSSFGIWLLALVGGLAYLFIQLGAELAPLLLGLVLGPQLEEYMLRSLQLSNGEWSVFLTRPVSAALLALAALLLVVVVLPSVKSKRKEAFVED